MNVYVLGPPPLTLIDAGPKDERSLEALERRLSDLGFGVSDIGTVVLTHQHFDHVGLAATVQARSGARVLAYEGLRTVLPQGSGWWEQDNDFAARIMLGFGIDAAKVERLRALTRDRLRYADPVEIDHGLVDGDRVELGAHTFFVRHRPGHSPSDIVLVDEESRTAIGGDHLLGAISSNPIIHLPLDGRVPAQLPRALDTYRRSLESTAADDLALVYTGHGRPIRDHRALIAARLAEQDERSERVLALIRDGRRTLQELIDGIWPNLWESHTFLACSEVLGHAELLTTAGVIAITDDNDNRFEPVAAS